MTLILQVIYIISKSDFLIEKKRVILGRLEDLLKAKNYPLRINTRYSFLQGDWRGNNTNYFIEENY